MVQANHLSQMIAGYKKGIYVLLKTFASFCADDYSFCVKGIFLLPTLFFPLFFEYLCGCNNRGPHRVKRY